MASAEDLRKQREQLNQLADLKEQLAGLSFSRQTQQAEELRKKINGITEALVNMGIQGDRIDAFYEAFIKTNAAISDVSKSLSVNLIQNINKLNDAAKEGLEGFVSTESLSNLKTGAQNITSLLQNTIKTMVDLETVATNKRRQNTKQFTVESINLTDKLASAYEQLIKNEQNLGTSKFKNLNVDKQISDVLIHINQLDNMRMQLAGGYYASLREQATTILEMLGDVQQTTEAQKIANEAAAQALIQAKERAEQEKELTAELEKQNKQLDAFNAKRAISDEKESRRARQRELNDAFSVFPTDKEIANADKEVAAYFADVEKARQAELANEAAIQAAQEKYDEALIRRSQIRIARARFEEVERQIQADKEYAKIVELEAKEEQLKKDAAQKIQDAQEKADAEMIARTRKRLFTQRMEEIKEEEKKQRELERIREKEEGKNKKQFDSIVDKILAKLPGGSILQQIAKMGVMAQLLAVAVGTILYLLFRWDNIVSKFTERLSVARAQAEATLKAAGGLANKLGLSSIFMEQIAEAIAKAQEGLGGMDISASFLSGNVFTERLIAGATVLSDTFGLTGQEIAGMTDASTAMGVSLSSNTIMVTAMSKGIMSANKLMQSLANLSPKLLTGFKGSNAQLISMVTKMKLLGVEANNVVSSNDKLLDIESSITNAFEAQVATGAQINIDRLMALQMNGKYSDVLDEQLKTLQQSDYLNRGALAQDLIAQGIGLDRETASQMMLRKILADKVGLTDELIRKRQKEGKMLEDDIALAEKQGRITKMEADRLRGLTDEYDSKTIQEKFIRALNDFTTALSSTLTPLVDVLRGLTTGVGSMMQSLSSLGYNLGAFGQGVISLLAGIGFVVSVGAIGGRALRGAKAMATALKAGRPGAVPPVATPSTGPTPGGSGSGMLKNLKNFKGLKAAGILGGIGAAVDFGLNMSEGKSFGESAGRAGISGAFGILGGILGGMVPVPGLNVATSIGGSMLGSFIGDKIGDAIFGQGPTAMSSADTQFLQSQLGTASTSAQANYSSEAAQAQATASELITTMKTISAKLDTANAVLNSINSKPSEVTVQLDGEKVGKAVVNYTAGVMDRGRNVGNTFGKDLSQNVPRSRLK